MKDSMHENINCMWKTFLSIKLITYNLYLRCKKCPFSYSMVHFMCCCELDAYISPWKCADMQLVQFTLSHLCHTFKKTENHAKMAGKANLQCSPWQWCKLNTHGRGGCHESSFPRNNMEILGAKVALLDLFPMLILIQSMLAPLLITWRHFEEEALDLTLSKEKASYDSPDVETNSIYKWKPIM